MIALVQLNFHLLGCFSICSCVTAMRIHQECVRWQIAEPSLKAVAWMKKMFHKCFGTSTDTLAQSYSMRKFKE